MKLLKFEASWCQPCKSLSAIMEGLELPVPVERVDIDQNMQRAREYNIRSVPTLVLVDDQGGEIKRGQNFKTGESIKEFFTVV